MKVAFLDRDGVINEEVRYLHKAKDFIYTHNCISALKIIQNLDYKIIIVTNQAGIAKGFFSESDYQNLTSWFLNDLSNQGVKVMDIFYCPHHPDGKIPAYSFACENRKPSPGMILKAKKKYNIDLKNSFLVGDKHTDIEAAMRAGVGKYYLVESGHTISKIHYKKNIIKQDLYQVAISLKGDSR